jgi:ribosomal protein S18 acetylase RimI-like enzyme
LGLSSADEFSAIDLFLNKNPDTCFVAVDDGKIIGTVLGGSDGRRGYLYHLAVQKTYQKIGLGKELSEKCLSALSSKGIKKCHIFVISSNIEGYRFWEKMGWLLRKDILVMSKDL